MHNHRVDRSCLICADGTYVGLTGAAVPSAGTAVPAAGAAVPSADSLSFLVLGDYGRQGKSGQSDVAKGMGVVAAQLKAQFVVTTGDNVYNNGLKSTTDKLFAATFTDIYTSPALNVPFYAVLGNHDWYGQPKAQLEGSKLGDARWNGDMSFGDGHVSTSHGAGLLDIFYIDTSPWQPEKKMDFVKGGLFSKAPSKADWAAWQAAQVSRLDGAMAKSTAAFKVVVGHHGIYSYSTGHGSTKELAPLNAVLRKHGASLYLNGHDHTLQTIRRTGDANGPLYVTSGAGSSTRDDIKDPKDGSLLFSHVLSGFSSVTITGDKLSVTHYDAAGKALHTASVAKAARPACGLLSSLLGRVGGADTRCSVPAFPSVPNHQAAAEE